jgi:DNA primase catalytic core
MISQEKLESVRSRTDLAALVMSRGVELTKRGGNLMGLCPFHDDTEPSLSVNPEKNLWHCFGCGAGGDAIRFVEMFDKLDFPDAVRKLAEGIPGADPERRADPPEQSPKPLMTSREQRLLGRVTEYYQHTMAQDPAALEYLRDQRDIRENRSLKDFGVGYANGTLLDIMPRDEEIIGPLKRIGVLNSRGREFFAGCAIFPLFGERGVVTGLYGRSISENAKTPHLYLPGPRTGLVNRQAAMNSDALILTESVIDALTLHDRGIRNVIPAYGTNGLTPEHLSLFNGRTRTIHIVFDADDAGRKGAAAVSEQLKEKGISTHIIPLPEKDVNLYMRDHTREDFEALVSEAAPESPRVLTQTLYRPTEHGFVVGYENRQYDIKGIRRGDTQLKVTIKASPDVSGKDPFELSTVDLYSSRSRIWFSKLCAQLFGVPDQDIRDDLGRILSLAEEQRPDQRETVPEQPTEAERAEAMRFLKNPDMFADILADFETLGITGEETNKLVGYLAAVSRKLDDPLSVLIQSRSAAGKSTLQDAVLAFVPEEDYVKYTRITDQALFYKEEDALMHKLIAIEEEAGMSGAGYSIRNIQSSKKITVAATGKDPGTGKMRTEEYTVRGPVAVMVTTTAAEVEGETASRFIFLTIDESDEMTNAIHKMQREAETLEGLVRKKKQEQVIRKHHAAQRLLRPLAVVNPFGQYLTYPGNFLRTRRDHRKYLGLIRTVAFLRQHQRKVLKTDVAGETLEYVEVTLEDIDLANRLADEVLGQSLDDLAKPSRTLLSGICEMVRDLADDQGIPSEEVWFNRRMIREHTGWTDWQIRAHIKQLEEMEYLYVRVGSRGKEYAYALNYQGRGEENARFCLNLTSVGDIRKLMGKRKAG